jgi:tripartite-type tricarboxylate transporter receptor subunit TctC
MKRTTCALICAALMALASPQASADPIEDFYRGKTLRMLIGYGPGGGYDLYGRLVAEFLPRFIPGNPTIVPQNMPGGGSAGAAKLMYEAAPKDGTVLAAWRRRWRSTAWSTPPPRSTCGSSAISVAW